MENLLDIYDKDYIEQYGLGGWLKENAGNLLTTAAGVGSMFIPGGQAAGLGMMAGGIAGMATSGQPEVDEPSESPYDDYGLRTVDQPVSTSNIRPMAMGGELTEYEGPSHAQGGIKLGGIGAEVEGGEARTSDIIHSDDILITQDILQEFGKGFGGDVPITKSDIGKSIADIIKSKEKKYEKYEGDKWNEMSRKAAHLPFEKMSTILADRAEIDDQVAGGYEMMAYGGRLIRKRDGMGPEGEGPMTGRGLGPCNDELLYTSGGNLPDWLYDARGEAIREEEESNELAKGGWIQKATASIERRGTEGVCTGSKFGGPTCRPGTRRYALAQTFRKMNKKQAGGPLLDEPEVPMEVPTDNWLTAGAGRTPVTRKTMELEFGDRGIPFSEDIDEFNTALKEKYPDQSFLPYSMEEGEYFKNFPRSFQIGEGGEKTGPWRPFLNTRTGYPIDYDKKQGGGLLKTKGLNTDIDTGTLATMPTSSYKDLKHNVKRDWNWPKFGDEFGMTDLLGVAPIIGSAIGAGRAFKREPEEVKYQRARYTPVSPALMDSTQQVEDVRGAFGTANLQMRQASPKDFLRRRTASATQEAGTIAGVRGGVEDRNVDIRNRAEELNARNRLYAEQMNTQIGMREQDANAANRAMMESVRDMYLNQLFTQAGQYSKDIKMGEASERYNQRYLDIIEGEKDSLGGVGSGNEMGSAVGPVLSSQSVGTGEDYSTDIGGQGFQTGLGADRQPGWFPGMDRGYDFNSNIRGMYPYGRFGSPRSRMDYRPRRIGIGR